MILHQKLSVKYFALLRDRVRCKNASKSFKVCKMRNLTHNYTISLHHEVSTVAVVHFIGFEKLSQVLLSIGHYILYIPSIEDLSIRVCVIMPLRIGLTRREKNPLRRSRRWQWFYWFCIHIIYRYWQCKLSVLRVIVVHVAYMNDMPRYQEQKSFAREGKWVQLHIPLYTKSY